ncbi:MAG: sigma-70 family RNA polymerase sigma factor [Lentisphaerae bacterium]|nr:sigma-70 family RNA polymerase sigma factor [Lentisphaerota bacterium]
MRSIAGRQRRQRAALRSSLAGFLNEVAEQNPAGEEGPYQAQYPLVGYPLRQPAHAPHDAQADTNSRDLSSVVLSPLAHGPPVVFVCYNQPGICHYLQRRQGKGGLLDALTHTEKVQKLFVRNMGPIRGIIIGMVADLSLAEDVLQEVFLVVTRKADDFDLDTNFMAWARAIVRRKVMEFVRERGKVPYLLGEEALEALAGAVPVEDEGWERRRKALADCLKSLPPRAGTIMNLRYAEGLDPQRIARHVSWSVGAIYVQLSRARRLLRDCVNRKLAMEGV